MEFLNRTELCGIVGRAEVNTFPNNSSVCNFSVVTEYSTIDKDRNSIIETNWFNVSAWGGRIPLEELYKIQKGVWIKVVGRNRTRKYTTQNGEERTTTDIIAHSVEILPREDVKMQPQRDY